MADRNPSQMLPGGTAAMRRGPTLPPYPEAFADAMVANFPQNPTLNQRRSGYAQILVQSGVPIEEAMAEAEIAIPSVSGSQMLPTGVPPHELGRGGDTTMLHVRPDEIPAIQKALDFKGTVNPRTGYLEFGGGGGSINGKGGSGNVSGGGRGNTSTGGGRGNNPGAGVDRVNDKLGTQQSSWGNRLETSYGAPYKTGKYGTVALPEDKWNAWSDQVDTYNEAANKWNAGTGRSFANFVNKSAPMGFSMQSPDFNRPSTYVDGAYHLGWNPGSLVGMATGAVLPGSGFITSPLAQAAYTALGGKDLMITGGDVPKGWDPHGAAPANPSPGAPSPTGQGGTSGASRDSVGTTGLPALLPPVTGAASPGSTAPGSLLPPITPQPQRTQYPGAQINIAGPSPYWWQKPTWAV